LSIIVGATRSAANHVYEPIRVNVPPSVFVGTPIMGLPLRKNAEVGLEGASRAHPARGKVSLKKSMISAADADIA
jgi:hypothetical protein